MWRFPRSDVRFYFARAILKTVNHIHVPYLLELVKNAYEQHEGDWDLKAEDKGVGLSRIEDGTQYLSARNLNRVSIEFPWCQQGYTAIVTDDYW